MPCSLELIWGQTILCLAIFMSSYSCPSAHPGSCRIWLEGAFCVNHSTVSDSLGIHGLLRLLSPWNPPGTNILKWLAISFSRGSFPSRDRAQVSCIVGRFFTIWATREAQSAFYQHVNLHLALWRSLEFSSVAVFSLTKFTCCVFLGPKHFHFKIFNSHKLFLFLFHAYYMYKFVGIFKK